MAALQISSIKELDQAVQMVRTAGERTVRALRDLLANESDSFQVLRLMKFSDSARPPGGVRRHVLRARRARQHGENHDSSSDGEGASARHSLQRGRLVEVGGQNI